jgi:hypothetical protein
MKLGKQEYKEDSRTVKMAKFIDMTLKAPLKFDFDKGRKPFPARVWGNDAYGDCVFAAQMNELLRVERIETRKTLPAQDQDVIHMYQTLTGCRAPSDENDNGYVMLDAFDNWRKNGWTLAGAESKHYTIDAYGELQVSDPHQLRLGCFLLHGVQFGFRLPRTAQQQTGQGYWDVVENAGSAGNPGSWGGHAVYGKKYDKDNFYVYTWGREIRVTNAFVEKYGDEAWCVVDSFDRWRKHPAVDTQKLLKYLEDIGAIKH